jgi:hypothetical protein
MLDPSTGVLCYTDASISPDVCSPRFRQAGIGIKFVNIQVQPANTICNKAIVKDVSSVLMAKAAALALAASIASNMGFMRVSFFTDSTQLLQFLFASDQTKPPDWRMKTYTQQFRTSVAQIQALLSEISRCDNSATDSLAKDGHHQAAYVHQPFLHCSFGAHPSQCQLFQTLLPVNNACTMLLSASCC